MVVNGWTIIAHPLFIEQIEKLISTVEAERASKPKEYRQGANYKLLKAIYEIAFNRIPSNPTDKRYRQGDTLGDNYKHWFRDKFGNGRFRLFFRFHSGVKIIAYAWVNDENNLRQYGATTDAYAVFKSMLESGNPPDSWNALVAACKNKDGATEAALDAIRKAIEGR